MKLLKIYPKPGENLTHHSNCEWLIVADRMPNVEIKIKDCVAHINVRMKGWIAYRDDVDHYIKNRCSVFVGRAINDQSIGEIARIIHDGLLRAIRQGDIIKDITNGNNTDE